MYINLYIIYSKISFIFSDISLSNISLSDNSPGSLGSTDSLELFSFLDVYSSN